MRIIPLFAFLILSSLVLDAAPTAEWHVVRAVLTGPDQSMLSVESTVIIQNDSASGVAITNWGGSVLADIEVFDEGGSKLSDVITTGPAPAFAKEYHIQKEEKKTFQIFPCLFVVAKSGEYSAKGRICCISPDGKTVALELPRVTFRVDAQKKKEPN